jgi:hypothetical protein
VLPLLDVAGAKILKLEEAVGEHLESEGRALAEMVAEHVLMLLEPGPPSLPRAGGVGAHHGDEGGYPGQRLGHHKARGNAVPASG